MPGKNGNPHGDVGNSYQLKGGCKFELVLYCSCFILQIFSDMFFSDEKSGGQAPWGQHDTGGAPLSTESVRAAAKVGLAAAAVKSKLFADHEEREIQRLSANIVNHQVIC